MKLCQSIALATKGLKVTFNGVDRKYQIIIEDDPFIIITKLETTKYYKTTLSIDIRDWEKIKNNVEKLLNKEI